MSKKIIKVGIFIITIGIFFVLGNIVQAQENQCYDESECGTCEDCILNQCTFVPNDDNCSGACDYCASDASGNGTCLQYRDGNQHSCTNNEVCGINGQCQDKCDYHDGTCQEGCYIGQTSISIGTECDPGGLVCCYDGSTTPCADLDRGTCQEECYVGQKAIYNGTECDPGGLVCCYDGSTTPCYATFNGVCMPSCGVELTPITHTECDPNPETNPSELTCCTGEELEEPIDLCKREYGQACQESPCDDFEEHILNIGCTNDLICCGILDSTEICPNGCPGIVVPGDETECTNLEENYMYDSEYDCMSGYVCCRDTNTITPDDSSSYADFGDYNAEDIINQAIDIANKLLGIVGSVALLFFIIAGVQMIFSGGSEEKIKNARTMMVQTIVGLVIFLSAYVIISFVQKTLIVDQEAEYRLEGTANKKFK